LGLGLRFLGSFLILLTVQILWRPQVGRFFGLAWVWGQRLGLVILVTAVSHAAAQPLAWWTFDSDHIEGTNVVDRAGTLNGSLQGPVRLAKDPFGYLTLDGKDNSVDIPNIQLDEFPTRQISVEA
jgi:hypothetical protein